MKQVSVKSLAYLHNSAVAGIVFGFLLFAAQALYLLPIDRWARNGILLFGILSAAVMVLSKRAILKRGYVEESHG